MTRERKLAVEMWLRIAERLYKGDLSEGITEYKRSFCERNNLHWQNSCYFCEYFSIVGYSNGYPLRRCNNCPLKSCANHSYYAIAQDSTNSNIRRANAAKKIAGALAGINVKMYSYLKAIEKIKNKVGIEV